MEGLGDVGVDGALEVEGLLLYLGLYLRVFVLLLLVGEVFMPGLAPLLDEDEEAVALFVGLGREMHIGGVGVEVVAGAGDPVVEGLFLGEGGLEVFLTAAVVVVGADELAHLVDKEEEPLGSCERFHRFDDGVDEDDLARSSGTLCVVAFNLDIEEVVAADEHGFLAVGAEVVAGLDHGVRGEG